MFNGAVTSGAFVMRNHPWRPTAGKKPTKKLLQEASKLVTPDTQDHMVVAMALRDTGVTQGEVISLFGHPHRNIIRKLLSKHVVKRVELVDAATRQKRIRLLKK